MAEPLQYRRPQSGAEGSRRRSAPLTPGYSDQLGTRQVAFEPGSDFCIEILRLTTTFAESPAFESALRARVEVLRDIRHPSLASVQLVERNGSDLLLESRVPAGRRLFEIIGPDNGWTFALGVVRDVLPALVALNEAGAVHGALSTERIMVTRNGRYVVTEHVLATAIESLHLSRRDLRAIGVVVPNGTGPVQFTHGTDLMQLGYLTLSLLVARPLDAQDFPECVPAWLDEFVANAGSPVAAGKVCGWLARAMQVQGATPFASIRDAQVALDELSEDVSVQGAESDGALLAFASEADDPEPQLVPIAAKPAIAQPAPASVERIWVAAPAVAPPVAAPVAAPTVPAVSAQSVRRRRVRTGWIVAAVSMLALAEAAGIGGLLYWTPTAQVDGTAPRPLNLSVAAALPPVSTETNRSARVQSTTPVARPARNLAPSNPKAAPVTTPRVGALTVTSAIDLQVLQAGVAIGSTAAPFELPDGRHRLDFVNQALGYRVSLPVTVTGGQMTTVKVPIPNGRVSINAVPWAQVTIDGADIGQTPLANVPLPIGSHEIVFTHPQYGERRQTVVVTVDGIARVTQTFR